MQRLWLYGLVLVILGVIVVFIATSLYMLSMVMKHGGEVGGGAAGCIVIFFIPICFGVGTKPQLALVLTIVSVILAVIVIVLSVLMFRKFAGMTIQTPLT